MRTLCRVVLSRWLAITAAAFALAAFEAVSRDGLQAGGPHDSRHRIAFEVVCRLWWNPTDMFTRVVPEPSARLLAQDSLASVTVNYSGFTPQAQAAFQHAVNIWQGLLTSPVPTVVNAQFLNLGDPLLLGSAGPTVVHRDFQNAPLAFTWFPAAPANKIAGSDLSPTSVEIVAQFNSTAAWYMGTDGRPPAGQVDFVSVVLHELGHGLGFTGSADIIGALGILGLGSSLFPMIYDVFVVDVAGTSILNTAAYPNGSVQLAAALRSGNLFWNGAAGIAANGGVRPRLYAPATWQEGSSYSHLDEAAFPAGNVNSLMTPAIGSSEAIHTPGPVTLGMFTDSGWGSAAPSCSYGLGSSSAAFAAAGVVGATVSVITTPGCAWTAASNSPGFITITGGFSGTGNGTVTYSVSANGSSTRAGTMTIAGRAFTVTQTGTGPTMTLDRTSLRFGAVTSGAALLSQTSAQVVRLTQSGTGTVTWTASSNQPWLQVSPASGSGSGNLSIALSQTPLPPGTYFGAIALTFSGAGAVPGPVAVTLVILQTGTSASPVGFVDTPANNQTGVTGAVPFTGWAIDDVEVTRVAICRSAVAGEAAAVDPNCGGLAQIFVGFAVFIEGARPDVQAAYPSYPMNNRAGWGFMVLTNMLPNQGNGTYLFSLYAQDRDGHSVALGTRTMTCANGSATKPFGAIDTPTQGGIASGSSFVNFGWALTPQPKLIPTNGSTMSVLVDGRPLGTVDYNHERADIEALFPGFQNTAGTNGAIGFRVIDTTTLPNGLHTISWTVVDSAGAIEGIGSRYFTVSNGAGALTAAGGGAASSRVTVTAEAIAAAPPEDTPVLGRRGWDLEGPWRWYGVGRGGRAVIRGEEIDRFELWLDAPSGEHYTGHLRVGGGLAAGPIGSQLDASTGHFTWAPGVGFVGTYDLVFVRWAGARAVARHEVRVILAPKGSGHVGVQVEIDTPRSQQDVGQPFVLAGWAADLDAATETGIDTLHVWAYPSTGGAPVFLGTPTLGGVRPDVAAVHGDQFREAGFALAVQGLSPGTYDLAVFPWSNVTGAFAPPKIVRVSVQRN